MHRVLERQIKQSFGRDVVIPGEWSSFLTRVSETYTHFEEDRALLDRSLDISSKEFLENSQLLQASRLEVEKQVQNLELEVAKRTKELDARIVELEDVRRAMTNLLDDFSSEQQALAQAKAKEDLLVKDLEKFKLAVDNASDVIIITDPEGVVVYANQAVEKTTGYTSAEAIGKKSGVLWKMPMPPEYYQKMWETIKTQKKVFIGEIQNKRKDGQVYTAIISISPLIDRTGKIDFFVGIERDITKAKEIDRAKTEFLAIASHALRTPLTAIDGLISMILDGDYGAVNPGLIDPLHDVNKSSGRLIDLVNDLLNLSRIQAGRMKYTLSDFSLTQVITETVQLMQSVAQQKGLVLLARDLGEPDVCGDSDKVRQVLNNLVGNSLKFTDSGKIVVSTKVQGEMVEIHVTDTGIGVALIDQAKLFGQFTQLESGHGRPIGTGLGLHISREMVVKMGGNLWIEASEVGKGSTFVFSLPKSDSTLAQQIKEIMTKEAVEIQDQKSDMI